MKNSNGFGLITHRMKMKLSLVLMLASFVTVQASTEVEALLTVSEESMEQTVSGTVTDSNGEALPGATVQEKGTNNGAVTDLNGNFRLTVEGPESVIAISSVGFLTQEFTVGNQTTFNVSMDEDLTALQEVVVVAYGTSNKKDLTGAVSVIGSEELNTFPATTVDEALQGKTAGVQITSNSGAPGASVSVNIRGVGSFGSTTPLYIVDGFPTQDISFINPTTIESLTVLKDASATALYGVRASNGVVIVQTKQGAAGKVQVELNSFIGFRSKPNSVDVLDVDRFAAFATELSSSDNEEVAGQADPYSEWSNPSNLSNIDWQDEIFEQAVRKSTTLSIRGGGPKSQIAFSAGIYDEEGTLRGSEFKRYDLGLNANINISEKVRVKSNIKYITSQNFQTLGTGNGGLLNVYATIPHLAPTGDPNLRGGENPTNRPIDGNGNFGAFPEVGTETFRDGINWVARALENDQDNLNTTILANADVEWDILDGLSTQLKLGGRVDNFAGWFFQPRYYRSADNIDFRDNAIFSNNQNTSNEWLAEYLLKYKITLADAHNVDVLAGTSAQRIFNRSSGATGVGFFNNNIRDIGSADALQNVFGNATRQTLASTFARLNYSYDNRYYITATIRRDGVGNVFSRNNLWGVFPSVAAGWNLDEESFMQNSPFDFLKLRGSWGETGSFAGIRPFSFQPLFVSLSGQANTSYSFTGDFTNTSSGLTPVGIPNPDLSWETQTQANFGIEGEALNGSLYFTFDYFNRESGNFLFNQSVPAESGFTSRPVNGGTVVNKGFEALVGYRKRSGDFSWDINANITTIDNELIRVNSELDEIIFQTEFLDPFNTNGFWYEVTRIRTGDEVGSFFGFVTDGIFQNQAEIDAANAGAPDDEFFQSEDTSPGDRRFRDLNGDGQITSEDRTIIGSSVPDFYGSVNLNVSYKGFDLGLNFYGTYGNDVLNLVKRDLESASAYGNNESFSNVSSEYFNNRWNGEGSTNTFPRALIDDNDIQNNRVSDHFVEDASFLRLRNVTIGYSLPASLINNIGLNQVRIYGSLQNLLTITNYSGSDPEIGQNADRNGVSNVTTRGIDAGAFPLSKSFTLGLNVKF